MPMRSTAFYLGALDRAGWRDSTDVYGILAFWRPITSLSLWSGFHLHGAAPVPFHAVNLGLHVLSAWLLGRLVHRLSSSRPAALASSLFFVTCPYHTEAVAWMAEGLEGAEEQGRRGNQRRGSQRSRSRRQRARGMPDGGVAARTISRGRR